MFRTTYSNLSYILSQTSGFNSKFGLYVLSTIETAKIKQELRVDSSITKKESIGVFRTVFASVQDVWTIEWRGRDFGYEIQTFAFIDRSM